MSASGCAPARHAARSSHATIGTLMKIDVWWLAMPSPSSADAMATCHDDGRRPATASVARSAASRRLLSANTSATVAYAQTRAEKANSPPVRTPAATLLDRRATAKVKSPAAAASQTAESALTRAATLPSGTAAAARARIRNRG